MGFLSHYMCVHAHARVIVIYLSVYLFTAPSIQIKGSPYCAAKNHHYILTCTVGNMPHGSYMVEFFKGNALSSFASVSQNDDMCYVDDPGQNGYLLSCGYQTDNSSSTSKEYDLLIFKLSQRDAVKWWCKLESTSIRSQNGRFKVIGKMVNDVT